MEIPAETIVAELPRCTRCRAAYRPSHFARPCRCPVCGHALGASAEPRGFRVSPVVGYGLLAVVLGAGIMTVSAKRFADRQAQSVPVLATMGDRSLEVNELPPDLDQLLQHKLQLLKKDLAAAPGDPVLLAALGDTYVYRARVTEHTSGPEKDVQRDLAAAAACVEKLRARSPYAALLLQRRLTAFPALRFVDRPATSPVSLAWRFQAGRELFPQEPVATFQEGGELHRVPVGGGYYSTGSPPLAGSPLHAGDAPGPAPGLYPPGPAPAPTLRPDIPPQANYRREEFDSYGQAPIDSAHLEGRAESLASPGMDPTRLRGLLRKHPDAVDIADRLAARLLRDGSAYHPARLQDSGQRHAKRAIEEALSILKSAARRGPAAIYRAAFYDSAAEACQRLEDWDEEFRLRRLAAREAPYIHTLWRKLERSALRHGELEAYQEAHRNAVKWSFPALEPELPPAP